MKKRSSYPIMALMALTAITAASPSRALAQDDYWRQRVSLFDKLPVSTEDIVFLGNSITDGGEFQELFGMENVLNRGIRSDRIDGVRKRLTQVTSGHPKMIFLLIGINDVADSNQTAASIASKYETLVKEIREQSPSTQLYIQSIMPINNDFKRYKSLVGREALIPDINRRLQEVAMRNGAAYIDLWPVLADPASGKMKREFTSDGLHLTGAGYRAWTGAVRPYVENAVAIIPEPTATNADEDASATAISDKSASTEAAADKSASAEADPTAEESRQPGNLTPLKRIEK